jgi:hypothetical protein
MENNISHAPFWAILLFSISFILSLGMLANPAKKAALAAGMTPKQAGRIWYGILFFYLLWLGYASILSLTGFLNLNTLPPRIFLFTSVPLFIFLLGLVANTTLFKKLYRAITLESLIYLHVFRVVGVFFLVLYFYHLGDGGFNLSAGIGDLATALLAIPVAKAVAQNKPWSIAAAYAWNVLGTLDILAAIAIATIGAIKTTGAVNPPPGEMTLFPFVWFPAFAPATITFLHITIFRKLAQQKQPLPAKNSLA